MPPAELRLTPSQQEALRQVASAAMRASGEVLADLILRDVEVGEPQISGVTWQELAQTDSEPMLVVRVEYVEGVVGSNLLVMRPADAARVAAMMMGEPGDEAPALDELHMSAVSEAMNQMMGASATALSQLFGRTIVISPPATVLRSFADNGSLLGEGERDDLVLVAFSVRVTDDVGPPIDSRIVQVFPGEFARRLSDEFIAASARPAAVARGGGTGEGTRSAGGAAQGASTPRPAAPAWEPEPLGAGEAAEPPGEEEHIPFEVIKRITVPVTVRLGEAHLSLQEVLSLTRGSIVQLDAADGQPVDVLVSGTLVARGEVVVVRERFGVRITQLVRPDLLSGAGGGG